jgi:hypothetical protein
MPNYISFDNESPAQQASLGANPKLHQKRLLAQLLLQQGMTELPTGHWSNALPKATNQILGTLLGRQANEELKAQQDQDQADMARMLAGGKPGSWTHPDTGETKSYGGGFQGVIDAGIATNNPHLLQHVQALQFEKYKTDADLAQKKALEDYKANVLLSPDKEAQITRINQSKKPLVSIDMAGQGSFGKQLGKDQAVFLMKEQAQAQRSADEILAIHKMRDAAEGGMYQGGGASLKEIAHNWLKGFGFVIDDATLANTGKFKSAVGKFLLDHAKELGANPSNADASRIEQIVGSIDTDPGAMQGIMDFMEESARRVIQRFGQRYNQVKQQPDIYLPYDLGVDEPPAYKSKSKNVGAGSGAPADDPLNPRLPSGKKGLFEGEDGEFRFYSSPDDQTLWGLRLSDGSWQQLTKDGQAIPIQTNSDKNAQAAPQKKDLYTLTPEAKDNWEAIQGKVIDFLEQAAKWRDDWNAQKESGNSKAQPSAAPQENKPDSSDAGNPIRITGDADYDKLPSGTEFIGPDGKKYRKP